MTEVSPQDWPALFVTADRLDHMQLIAAVIDLAKRVNTGAPSLVDQLVVHARVLEHRFRHRATVGGFPRHRVRTIQLAEMSIRGLAAPAREDPAVMVMNMVVADPAPTYVSTTAGYVRTAFAGELPPSHHLSGYGLATLPAALPTFDDAPVALYGMLQSGVSTLLYEVACGRDLTGPTISIINRVVHHRSFPWESGGWDGS